MLRSWDLHFNLEPGSGVPIYVQLARAISRDIQRGRLPPGSPLPGTRALSKLLKIHRNTVTAAYDELTAYGWITSEPSRGAFVSKDLPSGQNQSWKITFHTPKPGPQSGKFSQNLQARKKTFTFSDGTADARLAPVAELAVAFRRAAQKQSSTYADPRGAQVLREAVAEMLRSRRAVLVDSEQIIITRGSQMALYLAGQAVLSSKSVIAVEQLGYRNAWDAFRLTGASVIGVPVDEQGLDIQALRRLGTRHKIGAVYVTPHHQYPTAVTMTPSRRMELLEWANKTGAIIIEDDYDNEFHYEGAPLLPLASADGSDSVIYICTFSKMFAPGLRLGYVVAPKELISPMKEVRRLIDRQGDTVLESAIAELILHGHLQRHLHKTRKHYLRRRDAFAKHLQNLFCGELCFEIPPGGMALWVRPSRKIDTEQWAGAARKIDVHFDPSSHYSFDDDRYGGVRLGFASLAEEELKEASQRLFHSFMETRSKLVK